jgi:hypothetical protein
MGNDEVATRWAALLSLHELGHLVRHVDAVHGLYYLLMHFWVVAGSTPAALRVPSVIAMAAGAALVAILTRRLTGSGWAALFAGLLMALTPTITYYAQTARSYALVYACVALATLVLLRAIAVETGQAPGRASRHWIGYAALVALSAYLNEMALLVLAAHAVTVLLARYGQRVFWHWAAAAGAGAALVLPLLASSMITSARAPGSACSCCCAPSWPRFPSGQPGRGTRSTPRVRRAPCLRPVPGLRPVPRLRPVQRLRPVPRLRRVPRFRLAFRAQPPGQTRPGGGAAYRCRPLRCRS